MGLGKTLVNLTDDHGLSYQSARFNVLMMISAIMLGTSMMWSISIVMVCFANDRSNI